MLFIAFSSVAQTELPNSDSIVMAKDSVINDSLVLDSTFFNDSTLVDSNFNKNKQPAVSRDMETTVNYSARDSILMDMTGRKAYLYGDAHVDYGDITLNANYIEIDWVKSEVFAIGMPDSVGGDTVGLPLFKEKDDQFVSKEMRYNFKTKKGIIKEVVTQEGDGYIHGETVKINEKKELFIGDAVYTTCNLEHPHFAIVLKKIKVIPDKLAVTGPFNLQIAGVNTPIAGPFGLFPLPKEKTSGFIIPTYGQNYRSAGKGFYLKNGGYYFAISDRMDAELKGDIYTNGSWRADLSSNYFTRYKYKGGIQIALSQLKEGFDVDTINAPKGYLVKWSHSPLGGRNGKLTSSVDIRSANYNRDNVFNVNQAMMNNFSSSISYDKQLGKSPFSLSVKLRQDQKDSIQNYTLPDITLNMRRLQPFKSLPGKSSIWYKQIGIGYRVNAKNVTTNNQPIIQANGLAEGKQIVELDFLNFDTYIKNSKNGIKHSIPLTLPSFKLAKYFNLTPTAQYNEYWYPKKLSFKRVDLVNDFAEIEKNGFNRAYDYSTSLKLNTRLYGYLNFGRFGLQRIKQTMIPSITYVYKPSFGDTTLFGSRFYQTVTDTNGVQTQLSRFSGYTQGGPSLQKQQTLNFSLNNVFEAKVRSKKDTTGKSKYIKLLDSYNIGTSYNFAKDSLNWSDLKMTARTTFKGISATLGSTHDLYDFKTNTNEREFKVNEFAVKNGRPEPRLTAFNAALSTNLNPKKRKKEEKVKDLLGDEDNSELDELEIQHIYDNLDEYVDFDIPWSLRIEYNVDWRKALNMEKPTIRQSIKFGGDVSLTSKWKFTFSNVGYDLVQKEMIPPRVGIIRDLHCWEMRFNYQPFGFNRGFTFDINVKAPTLQSLKLSKKDDPRNR